MKLKFLATIGLLAVIALAACGRQAPSGGGATSTNAGATGNIRTAWGDPDLQGVWENLERAPLERPKEFGTKEFLTEQEAAARAKRTPLTTSGTPTVDLPAGEAEDVIGNLASADNARNKAADSLPEDAPGRRIVGAEYNAFWNAPLKASKQSLRTSQIVDPPDGRLPAYTRDVLTMRDEGETARSGRSQGDSWEDRG